MTNLEWLLLGGFFWLAFRLDRLGRQLGGVCYVIRRDLLKNEEEKAALLRERLEEVKDQRQQDWGLGIMGTIPSLASWQQWCIWRGRPCISGPERAV